MKDLVEIRWHGRGGQGAKTAALLFADAALDEGLFVQAFPEYGPERMGAPVSAFNRLSRNPITLHSGVASPEIVVVLDPTLMETQEVTAGLPAEGKVLINSPASPSEIKERYSLTGFNVFTVDASRIARETIGRPIPNTPMLGALIKVTGLLSFETMLEHTRIKLGKKFKDKPEIVEGNVAAIRRAYQEVKS